MVAAGKIGSGSRYHKKTCCMIAYVLSGTSTTGESEEVKKNIQYTTTSKIPITDLYNHYQPNTECMTSTRLHLAKSILKTYIFDFNVLSLLCNDHSSTEDLAWVILFSGWDDGLHHSYIGLLQWGTTHQTSWLTVHSSYYYIKICFVFRTSVMQR